MSTINAQVHTKSFARKMLKKDVCIRSIHVTHWLFLINHIFSLFSKFQETESESGVVQPQSTTEGKTLK